MPPPEGTPEQLEWVEKIQKIPFLILYDEANPIDLIIFAFSLIKTCEQWIDYRDVIVELLEEEMKAIITVPGLLLIE